MIGFDWMGLSGWVWMVAALVLVVIVALAVLGAVSARNTAGVDDAARILKARFARGEMTPDEFEQARRLLGH